ncbi:MAG TPA: multicopper oxidase domain-containing protein [Rhizomicrobium sp.]|nr:multicopper oxidase domain-containing protein [Rhizomicrobium sp.]
MSNRLNRIVAAFAVLAVATFSCLATGAMADTCKRPLVGSDIKPPPDIYSQNGVLSVTLDYFTTVDAWGRTLFCYVAPGGMESPTLHVNPGDKIEIRLRNKEPTGALGSGVEQVSAGRVACGSSTMMQTSINIHFHGMNVKPRCHGDEVIHTIVNPGETFAYNFRVPTDEPPGLYWYHAHIHGIASPAVQGGASGAIEVEGIANLQPAVAGLPQRYLVFRDEPLAYPPKHGKVQHLVPFWDVSLNYVPIPYPYYKPAVIKMQAGAKEFWRFVNASADTVADIKVLYDGKPQPLQIVAFDGVPTGSQDGTHKGTIITQSDILVPTAGRVEFIVTGPSAGVKEARLITERIDTGPAGDVDTQRPLANIRLTTNLNDIPKPVVTPVAGNVPGDRFADVDDSMVTAHRLLFFCELPIGGCGREVPAGKHPPSGGTTFFITVNGQQNEAYQVNEPPKIVTYKGAVEDWTIENRAQEIHEFHIHQIHFQVIAVNGVPVPEKKRQWYDTYQVGYWDGKSKRYPSITVRMDFRGDVVGEFVYHCHILDHEDGGMMANILVLPASGGGGPTHQASAAGGKVKKASAGGTATRA